MFLRRSIFLLGCIFAIASHLPSQILTNPAKHEMVLKGIDLTLRQDYDSAELAFQKLIKLDPWHPVGYLYLAGMLQARYTDEGDQFDEERYDSLLNAAESLSEPLIEASTTAAAGYFYSGSAKAFRSYTRSENGNIPSGVYYGLSAGSTLQKCLERDSSYLQAKNILGSFYYWRSKLAWIPFVPDRSEEGIAMIRQAYFHPYEKHLASHNLIVILTEEKRYAEAERYALDMLAEYPDNRLFLWGLMTVYEKWDRKKELHDVVALLLKSTMRAKMINRYTEAMCRLKLARYAAAENNKSEASRQLTALLSLKKYVGLTKGNLGKKISDGEELLKTLNSQ